MHEKSIYWVALLALGLVVAPAATQGQVVNLVKNPSFEQDEVILDDPAWDQWCTWGSDAGLNSTVKIDTTQSIDGARSLRIDPKGNTNWYFIVLNMPMPQKVGTKYTASLWAKGQAPRPLGAQFKDTGNTVSWGYTDFQITADWAEYHFTAPRKLPRSSWSSSVRVRKSRSGWISSTSTRATTSPASSPREQRPRPRRPSPLRPTRPRTYRVTPP